MVTIVSRLVYLDACLTYWDLKYIPSTRTHGQYIRQAFIMEIKHTNRYMRVMAATYVGNMMSDANMTFWGNEWARQAIVEFDRFGTLSEVAYFVFHTSLYTYPYVCQFNSATYAGVSLFALSLWGYMPQNSTIFGRGADIIAKTWDSIGKFYNPTLKTLGGPWDRSYGFNMVCHQAFLQNNTNLNPSSKAILFWDSWRPNRRGDRRH